MAVENFKFERFIDSIAPDFLNKLGLYFTALIPGPCGIRKFKSARQEKHRSQYLSDLYNFGYDFIYDIPKHFSTSSGFHLLMLDPGTLKSY